MTNESYIELPVHKVERLCKIAIQTIEQHRRARKQSYLAARLHKINNGFFRKLFRLKPVQEKDLIRDLDRACIFDEPDWHTIWLESSNHYLTAQRLLRSAKATTRPMFISVRDYELITEDVRKI